MKQAMIFFVTFCLAVSIQAQQRGSEVLITINGNKNLQLSLDGRDYPVTSSSISGNKTTLSITNLDMQQHTLLVTRINENNNRSQRISVPFNLRNRFDMHVKVNGNGSLELIETRRYWQNDNHVAMSDANFSILLRNVRNQRSLNGRRTVVNNAFNVSNTYFTTSQVVQLLRQVTSESYRLQLAKTSYPLITDKNNFRLVSDLLTSESSRNQLEEYVNNYNDDSDDDYDDNGNGNAGVAMSDADFSTLLRRIQQQWPVRTQLNSITESFNDGNNNFTSYQARQLIQIVDAEDSRLQLAKLSYRSITDPANFSQVSNLLTRQASRDELNAYINNSNNGGTTNTAMSTADFNTLYQTISGQFFPNEQMNSLTTTFNNTSYYFTTAQARQLIQLVSYESNRLQLAKLSYRTITDRNNFSQLYDIFSSQASKTELDNYVRTYAN